MIKHWLSVKIQSSPSMRIVQPNRQRKLLRCSFSQDSSISWNPTNMSMYHNLRNSLLLPTGVHVTCGYRSKPSHPGKHQNSWDMDVHLSKKEHVVIRFNLQYQVCGNQEKCASFVSNYFTQVIWGAVHIAHLTKKRHFLGPSVRLSVLNVFGWRWVV